MPPQSTSAVRNSSSSRKGSVKSSSSRDAVKLPALTKRDLVLRIAGEKDLPQEMVHGIVQRTLDLITEALSEDRHIEFRDFGVFEITHRSARIGRNPNRPEDTVTIPERKVVKFKPGKRMKSLVSET